jgi:tetratricopeptide (TPR) repeat protein
MSAAQCYAETSGIKGHWDEEIHGLDYLTYAYLQQGRDDIAKEQVDYLSSMQVVFPMNNKIAYTFAAVPTRYALERKDWQQAIDLELKLKDFPWENFPWERSMVSFGRVLGAVHLKKHGLAAKNLAELKTNHTKLVEAKKTYEANQVDIQIKAAEAWIKFSQGQKNEAIGLMTKAADMEDATDKHPVTPGEVVPARELLGDMYFQMGDFANALRAYEGDLERHKGRFNALYGAALSAKRSGDRQKAQQYFLEWQAVAKRSSRKQGQLLEKEFLL